MPELPSHRSPSSVSAPRCSLVADRVGEERTAVVSKMAVSVRRVRYIEMMLPWNLTSRHSIDVAAAAASLYSAHAKTMVPLRVAAIVGNILAMAYSFMLGTYLIFMLNTALLALHG